MTPGGTYAVLLYLARQTHLQVGQLGPVDFPRGYYLYLGSALGGLKSRISRHLRRAKVLRWHIDYLAARADIVEVWWLIGRERLECQWAELASQALGASRPVMGFGSSDCRCFSHLEHFEARPSVSILGAGSISTLMMDEALSDQQPAFAPRRRAHSDNGGPEPLTPAP